MLKKISHLFGKSKQTSQNPRQIDEAVAILLVEIMHADHFSDADEQSLICQILRQHFGVDEKKALALFERADTAARQVVSLQEYTRFLNQSLEYPARVSLIEHLWQVVFADGQVDKYEEHLVRKIADLLYVKHQDFIRSKHRAEQNK